MFEKNPYRKVVPVNIKGRDFVVGDLHGCRSLLDEKLETVQFDPSQDRLFSAGDLVDRGPESEKCLDLLKEPWFFAVMGNHDAMLMAWIFGRKKGDKRQNLYEQAFIHNAGCDWVKRYYRASEHLPLLETLPFILEVEGQFQMVHAEMLDAMSGEVAPDSREDAMADHHFICGFDAYGDWLDHLLWGRSIRWKHRINQPLNPLSAPDLPTYCGHTIFKEVQTLAGHTFLDLGAYATGKLTVMEVL